MFVILAFGSAFFAGITAILAKIGIRNTDSNLATALRTVVVLLFAWLMVFVVGSQYTMGSISSYSLIFLILSGLATGGSWLFFFKALQIGEVNKVIPVDKSSTIMAMVLAIIFLSEGITLLKVLCMILIAGGTYMMIYKPKTSKESDSNNIGSDSENEHKSFYSYRWLIYALLGALFAALTAILGKVGISGVESNLGVAIRTSVVIVLAWIVVFANGKQKEIKSVDKKSWIFLALSGLTTGLSWLCYYRALQEGPASVVVPIDKLSILVTVAFAFFALKEKLSKLYIIGLILVVAGTLLLLV
jgi:transporter family protein